MRLLLVEDDPLLGESVRDGLLQDGFAVDWVQDAAAAALALRQRLYALVLLDLGLPGKSGLELLREQRRSGNLIPMLIITARDAVADRVEGLNSGADDYLVKPFDLDELAARIHAISRRLAGRAAPLMTYGGLALNPATHEATLDGAPLELSAREFALLEALLERPGAVLSREQLEDRLYGWNEEVESNAIEVHIHHLRRKLGSDFIRTIRGVGYTVGRPA